MKRFAVTVLLLCAVMGVVPVAASAAAPAASGNVDVQLWPGADPGQLLVIVGITLPDSVKLPATVQIPVPDGMTLGWAGEISSSTAGDDIAAKPVTKTGKGGDYVEFEVTRFRVAQAEFTGIALGASGSNTVTEVKYVQTVPAPLTGFAVRLPATASEVRIKPSPAGDPTRNSGTGEQMYTLPSKEFKPGDSQTIEISYTTALPSAGGPDRTTTILLVLAGLVVFAAAVLAFLVIRQKRSSSGLTE